jgi:signal transduction histidine kinase
LRVLRSQPILRQVLGAFGIIAFLMGIAAFYAGLRVRAERAQDVQQEAGVIAATAATLVNGSTDSVDARKNVDRVLTTVPLPEGSVARVVEQKDIVPADGWGFQLDADGVERFHGSARIGSGPLAVDVGIPRSEVLRRLEPMWRRNLILVALMSLSVLCLASWVAWHTAIALRRLQKAAGRIASGDLSPVEQWPVPNREMAELQISFATMAEKLRHARETLDKQFAQERRMLEAVQSLQRQVVRQERLAAVGLLVSGIAHELNNPLQAILGTIEVVERQSDMPAEVVDDIAQVKAQSNRARDIIRNLSRFSKQQASPPSLVDLRDVISSVVQLRKRELDSAAISLDIEMVSVQHVLAAFNEVEQVVLNFVVNAQQAVADTGRRSGRILIKLTDDTRKVRLEVWDDGPGVPAENEHKLFQPFFTTKPVGTGTGLGLSVSYGIIDAYGGSTGYFRNEWGGATFFIELPVAGGAEAKGADDRAAVLQRRVSSRV